MINKTLNMYCATIFTIEIKFKCILVAYFYDCFNLLTILLLVSKRVIYVLWNPLYETRMTFATFANDIDSFLAFHYPRSKKPNCYNYWHCYCCIISVYSQTKNKSSFQASYWYFYKFISVNCKVPLLNVWSH